MARPRWMERVGALTGSAGMGVGLIALIQLPGTLLANALGATQSLESRIATTTTLAALLLLAAGRLLSGVAFARSRLKVAACFAVATTLGLERFVVPKPGEETHQRQQGDLFVYPPGKVVNCDAGDCNTSRLINALGFRGPLPDKTTPLLRRIVVLGDSHVYGSGVRDEETLPRTLQHDLDPSETKVAVFNGGIEGLSLATFPSVARRTAGLEPDLLVALVKDDDVDETDRNTRLLRAGDSFGTRLLAALNLELPRDVLRRFAVLELGLGETPKLLVRQLDALYEARSGSRLLLLSRLQPDLEHALDRWLETHPDVFQATIDGEAWQQAPKLPDGHPNGEGYRLIVKSVAPAVRHALEASDRRARKAP